jgi:hypothetical protein
MLQELGGMSEATITPPGFAGDMANLRFREYLPDVWSRI